MAGSGTVENVPGDIARTPRKARQSANTDTLADFPDRRHIRSQRGDPAHYLVTGYTRRLQRRIGTVDVAHVGATDAAGINFNQHFARAWCWRGMFHQFQKAWLGDLHGTVCRLHILRS